MGFQNAVLKVAARLDEHRAVIRLERGVYSSIAALAVEAPADDPSRALLESLAEGLRPLPPEALKYHILDENLQAKVGELLAPWLDELPEKIKEALLRPDRITPTGLQDTIIRFAARLEEYRAARAAGSSLFLSLRASTREGGDPDLGARLERLASRPDVVNGSGYRKAGEETRKMVSELLADILNGKKEIEIPETVRAALLDPDPLTPVILQNAILTFASKLEIYKLEQRLGRELFIFLLQSMDQKSGQHRPMEEQRRSAAKVEDGARFSELPEEVQGPIREVLEAFLNAHPEVSTGIRKELLEPGKGTPTGLHRTVLQFARDYDMHRQREVRAQAVYIGKLMMCAVGHALVRLAKESGYGSRSRTEKEGEPNYVLTGHDRKGPWRNYMEPD